MGGEEKGRGRKKRQGCGSSGDWELLLRLLAGEEAHMRCEAGAPATGRKAWQVVGGHGFEGEDLGGKVVGSALKPRERVAAAWGFGGDWTG